MEAELEEKLRILDAKSLTSSVGHSVATLAAMDLPAVEGPVALAPVLTDDIAAAKD